MLQIYAPMTSTETRLMYIRKNKEESFEIKDYDVKYYEQSLAYFNIITRHQEFNELPPAIYNNIIGYDNGYESLSEYMIILEYLKLKKRSVNIENIIKTIYDINMRLIELTGKNLIMCPLVNSIKKFSKNNKCVNDKYIGQYRTLINDKYNNIVNSLKIQIECFKEGIILSESEYKNQIKMANYALQNINDIYTKCHF